MRHCTVCRNAHIEQIDEALIAGKSQSATAREFQVSRDALVRHAKHFAVRSQERAALARREAKLDIAAGRPPRDAVSDLFGKIAKYEARLHRVLRRSERRGRNADTIAALRELTRLAELGAKGSAALQPKETSTNVGRMIQEAARLARAGREAEWAELSQLGARELLERALRLFDEKNDNAIAAVADALRAMQRQAAPVAAVVTEAEPVVDVEPEPTLRLAPVVNIDRPSRHRCTSGCTPFSCSEAALREHDGADPGELTNWRDAPI